MVEQINIAQLMVLNRLHALAFAGSAGQGAKRARHCMKAENANIMADAVNTHCLYSDMTVIHGNAPTNPANAAPMPSVTSNAGSAQQISVPMLVNRLKAGMIV